MYILRDNPIRLISNHRSKSTKQNRNEITEKLFLKTDINLMFFKLNFSRKKLAPNRKKRKKTCLVQLLSISLQKNSVFFFCSLKFVRKVLHVIASGVGSFSDKRLAPIVDESRRQGFYETGVDFLGAQRRRQVQVDQESAFA